MRRPFAKDRPGRAATAADGSVRLPRIEGYDQLSVIGRGASATVYRARQASHDRDVAIKVLNVDISDRRARRRFERERSVNGRLSDHPNVVTVLESGLVDGRQPYLAMELFEHGSLADRLRREGAFAVADVLHHGIRVAGALERAHGLGVLHRDIKPHNILLSRYGEPALADFGIASILEQERAMTAALTPNHAAPELLEGEPPTPRSDLYSLGSSLYMLLAGTPPFAAGDDDGVLAQLLRITTSDVPPLPRTDVPSSLETLVQSLLSKDPAGRPASAGHVGRALQEVQHELGLPVTPLPVDEAPDAAMPPTIPSSPSRPARSGTPSAVIAPPTDPAFDDETIDVPADHVPARRASTSSSFGDNTGDFDDPTVVGRAASVRRARPSTERRRRWPLVAAWVAAAVVIALAIPAVVSLVRDDGDGDPAATPAPVPASEEANGDVGDAVDDEQLAADAAAVAPTGVQAIPTETGLLVTWDDEADGAYQFVVVARLADGSDVAADQPTEPGAETATIAVDADRVECVTVMAILGRRDGELVRAESDPFCP